MLSTLIFLDQWTGFKLRAELLKLPSHLSASTLCFRSFPGDPFSQSLGFMGLRTGAENPQGVLSSVQGGMAKFQYIYLIYS
jgi:hypothetical protein